MWFITFIQMVTVDYNIFLMVCVKW